MISVLYNRGHNVPYSYREALKRYSHITRIVNAEGKTERYQLTEPCPAEPRITVAPQPPAVVRRPSFG